MGSFSEISALASNATQVTGQKGQVLSAIRSASLASGVDFSYLLQQAEQESSLNPTAKASTSSATGLYQFIDQTWLQSIKQNGDKYGLGEYADQINIGSDGVARVSDKAALNKILDLRKNPEISAQMAAELAVSNQKTLTSKVGGDIGSTELYLAHFLGANGASSFLNEMKANPNATAAEVLPKAAQANKSVFYASNGQPRSVSEVYQKFAQKFESATETGSATTQYASLQNEDVSTDLLAQDIAQQAIFSSTSKVAACSSYSSNNLDFDCSMSTPMAAMILAQMDMESFAYETVSDAQLQSNSIYGEKTNAYRAYGAVS